MLALSSRLDTSHRRAAPWPASSRVRQSRHRQQDLPEKPDNATLLKLYALYKQASGGDVEGKRPGFTDMVGRAKWDAWNAIKGKDATRRCRNTWT